MEIRILGCSGGSTPDHYLTSYLVDGRLLIDASSASKSLTYDEQLDVHDVLITHLHMDHICGLGFLYENTREERKKPLNIHAPADIIAGLKDHLFCKEIFPGSSYVDDEELFQIELHVIEHEKPFKVGPYDIEAVVVNHYGGGTGYILARDKESFMFTGDTGPTDRIWEKVKDRGGVDIIITEISFPNFLKGVAEASKHLSPDMLEEELDKVEPGSTPVYISHLKPMYMELLLQEISDLTKYNLFILKDGDVLKTGEVRGSEDKGHGHDEEQLAAEVPWFDFSKDMKEQREDISRNFGKGYKAGDMIFEEGDADSTMYIIQEGRVQVFRRILGSEKVLALLGQGDIFGEMAMLNRRARSASVRAIADTKVLIFDRVAFERLIMDNYGIALKLIRTLAQRIDEADVHIENLMLSDNESKVLNTIIWSAKDEGIPVSRGYHLKLTPEELAIRTSLNLGSLKEILARFMKSRLISLRKDTMVIKDLRKLERLLSYLELKDEFREI
jgi:CRP-like cAMP-binding protein/ribonuclease BN (tRNA processing enzyme)